jgi:myo-inositol-1(or 4)-monophosphatase
MEIEGASAAVLGVELDLPHLAERVGLDEMTLVVYVESMVDRVVLQVGHVPGHIDNCHRRASLPVPALSGNVQPMDDDRLLEVLRDAAGAVTEALEGLTDWGLAGTRDGQYRSDLAADAAALGVLDGAGLGVMSEESGPHRLDRPITVVIDPVDGSTNASHGLPWFATSLCAVDAEGPKAAVVVNQSTGTRFDAVRGGGARRDGRPVVPSTVLDVGRAFVGISGFPGRYLGWKQFRALGAAALDLCAVACGSLDAYIDCSRDAHGPWDYLGGMLVCTEAGALIGDAHGRDLVTLGHEERRTPVAASTAQLFDEVLARRQSLDHR